MIIKFFLEVLLISLLIYMVYAKFFKKPKVPKGQAKTDGNGQFKKSGDSVMIACVKCGTFAESLDSVAVDGKFYCSKECAGVR